jgi:hypothetical protein
MAQAIPQLPVLGKAIIDDGIRERITAPITLTKAAEHFRIDLKTLRKKLQDLGITPQPDPKDKRNRLLTPEQFELVQSDLLPAKRRPSQYSMKSLFGEETTESALIAQAIAQAQEVLQGRQRYLEQWEARLTEREKLMHEMMMALLRRADKFAADYESELDLLKKREGEKATTEKSAPARAAEKDKD